MREEIIWRDFLFLRPEPEKERGCGLFDFGNSKAVFHCQTSISGEKTY